MTEYKRCMHSLHTYRLINECIYKSVCIYIRTYTYIQIHTQRHSHTHTPTYSHIDKL